VVPDLSQARAGIKPSTFFTASSSNEILHGRESSRLLWCVDEAFRSRNLHVQINLVTLVFNKLCYMHDVVSLSEQV